MRHRSAAPAALRRGADPGGAGGAALRARGVGDEPAARRRTGRLPCRRAGVRAGVRQQLGAGAAAGRRPVRLRPRLPSIRLELQERPSVEIVEALYQKETDIGIIVRGGDLWQLRTRMYAEDRLAIVVPSDHPLAQGGPVAFASVLKEELVTLDHATAVHRLVADQARRSGQTLRVRVQVRSFEAMCQMVRHGLGLGILPELAAQPLVAAFGLTLLLLDEPWARRELAICTRSGDELDASAQRLIDFLVTCTEPAGTATPS
ncbi:LysR substrate-binding domain-containing protein [Azospirillum formosense]|uniref:LysR substrate-binding domain-containing protein n=1 Tax=Azospirillum formosense TaxID=861533 RepID=UPI001FFF4566|nr:LysR substrate-binding domain-containing protein [Azospirillum formosense]